MTRRCLTTAAIVGLGLLMAGTAFGSPTRRDNTDRVLFAHQTLLPGQRETAQVTIPAAPVSARPFLQLADDSLRCTLAGCATSAPDLAARLHLTVSDTAGATWQGSLAQTRRRLVLPGGSLSPGQTRTYTVSLELPATAGNEFQDLAVSGQLVWGGMDASGQIVTAPGHGQLGPKPGGTSGQPESTAPSENSLPFTGLDVARLAATGLILVAGGAVLVDVARRLRRQ
jgi:hypothetical protein